MPPPIQAESILEYVPNAPHVIKVDANIIAYFGDYFHAFQEGLRQSPNTGSKKPIGSPLNSARISPINTASAQNQS